MKSNNIFTSILVFVCFALYVKIELTPDCKESGKECSAINKKLEAENDSLKQNNKILDEKYAGLKERADSLQEKLSNTKQTIVQLKSKQHEKVNAIDALTNDELFRFFSEFETKSDTSGEGHTILFHHSTEQDNCQTLGEQPVLRFDTGGNGEPGRDAQPVTDCQRQLDAGNENEIGEPANNACQPGCSYWGSEFKTGAI